MEHQDSQFREIFEKSPIGILFYDKNGITVNANNSALKMLGFPRLDDVLGHNLFDNHYISEKKDELLREGIIRFQAPLNLEKIKDYDLHSQKKGVIFLDYTVSVTDSGYLVQIQDITEHKKGEDALIKSEYHYKTIFDNIEDGFQLDKVLFDKDGNPYDWVFLKVNKAFERQTGLKETDVLGKRAKDIIPAIESYWISALGRVAKTGTSEHIENYNQDTSRWYDDYIFKYGENQVGIIFRDITERKKLEEELLESQERFRLAILNSPVNYSNQDLNLEYTWIYNPQLGYSPADVVGQNDYDLLPSETAEHVIELKKRAIKSNNTVKDDVSIEVDSTKSYYNFVVVPLHDSEGKVIGVTNIVIDITERKKLEEELRKSHDNLELKVEERTAELEKEVGYINALYNLNTKFIEGDDLNSILQEVLNAAISLTRADKGNIQLLDPLTSTLRIAVHKNYEPSFLKFFESVNTEKPSTCGTAMGRLERVIVADVTESSIFKGTDALEVLLNEGIRAVQSTPIISKNGELVGMISTHFGKVQIPAERELRFIDILARQAADIIQRIKDEEEINAAHDEITQSQKLLQDIINGYPSIIFVKDVEGRFLTINNKLEELLGIKSEELKGKTDYDIFSNEEAEYYREHDRRVLEEGKALPIEEEADLVDGHHVFIANKFPIYDINGEPYGVGSISTDFTERKKMDEELKRSNAELQQFAYVSSHDLQEPLRTIASFTQLLERRYKGKFDSDADEFMGYIVDAAKRMQRLINDLLEYSRVTTQAKEFKPVNVEEVLNIVLSNLKTLIDEDNVEIVYDKLPTVNADELQLVQLFQNLIGNAIKFRKTDEPPKIHISAHKDEDKNEYVFSVSDNGIGIEKQYLDRIFVIFQRLHTIDVYKGTGIGLSVAKKIVERHGGRMWVESEFGEGSTFYFSIPVKSHNYIKKDELSVKNRGLFNEG